MSHSLRQNSWMNSMSPSWRRSANARTQQNGPCPSVGGCAARGHRHGSIPGRPALIAAILLTSLVSHAHAQKVRLRSYSSDNQNVQQSYGVQSGYPPTAVPNSYPPPTYYPAPSQPLYSQPYAVQTGGPGYNSAPRNVGNHVMNPRLARATPDQPLVLPAPLPAQPRPAPSQYRSANPVQMTPGYSPAVPGHSTQPPPTSARPSQTRPRQMAPNGPSVPGYGVPTNAGRPPSPSSHQEVKSAAIAPPWWQREMQLPLLGLQTTNGLSLNEALQTAAARAPEISALRADVDQRRAELLGQAAAFDWTVFAESAFDRDSVPVGSSLDGTTGRLRERTWDLQSGLRNLNRSGGTFSIYHDFGYRRSNSSFLTPPTQGTGRVTAEYTQPLLRSSGEVYNTGRIAIAGSRQDQSEDQLSAGMENYLLRVAQAYWGLALARGEVILARRARSRTSEILDIMNRRRDVDVGRGQLLRAQAANATRQTDWTEATFEARRAQERLLRLIHGEAQQDLSMQEVLTTSSPTTTEYGATPHVGDLAQHPQVAAAQRAIQASAVELRMSQADLQPKLDLVLSAYSAGLHGQGKFDRAYQKAWTDSEPGYSVGLNFEYPLGNRRAVAGRERSEAQLRRLQSQFQVVVSDVALNIRDRVIAVQKASSVLLQSADALSIVSQDLSHLQTRRELLVDGSKIADLYLDALLRSQDRLSTAELRVLRSQVDLEAAMVNLQHARGELRKRLSDYNHRPR